MECRKRVINWVVLNRRNIRMNFLAVQLKTELLIEFRKEDEYFTKKTLIIVTFIFIPVKYNFFDCKLGLIIDK